MAQGVSRIGEQNAPPPPDRALSTPELSYTNRVPSTYQPSANQALDGMRRAVLTLTTSQQRPSFQPAQPKEAAMRQSQVKPGVRALLSLGRHGAVAVTVIRRALISDMDQRPHVWVCEDSRGRYHSVTARQLRPLPVTDASGKLIGYAGADGGTYPAIAGKRFTGLGYVDAGQPGQTIDAGDVLIETTLHRLG